MGLFTPNKTEYEKFQERIEAKRAKQAELEDKRQQLEAFFQTAILDEAAPEKVAAQIKEVTEALELTAKEISILEAAALPHRADYLRSRIQECEAQEQKYNQECSKLNQAFEKKKTEFNNAQKAYWEQIRVPSSMFDKARNERERLEIELDELERQASGSEM
ncbi:hypothetical protein [Paenibacillus sp. PDC88]|uniref:hypothetical protein n=1 Tax=Paenibacillus TaxID=44249 RepID=UPI00089810FF|nr:hypothetical protein [Paenibacillus sp. PDC88]SDX82520.1 hypothetical protein SAMN05518848_11811 [Paenibacillus sp. PDC88]